MVAISFPPTPIDGQVFNAPNGVTYTYDASDGKWRASAFLLTDELNDLTDVTLAGLLPGQALRYSGTNWANAYLAASEVTNTPAGNITSGDVQAALNELDGFISALPPPIDELNDLSDVTITAPADNNILRFDLGGGQWINDANQALRVVYSPTAPLTAINVQGALDEAAAELARLEDEKPDSDATGITGASVIDNIVSISQADYDAIGTPDPATVYLITG